MKRFLSALCTLFVTLSVFAQLNLWQDGSFKQYLFSEIDSITFGIVIPERFSIQPISVTMVVGEVVNLYTNTFPLGDYTFEWKSSNSEVATVNQDGLVTALSEGEAFISATIGDKQGLCYVRVNYADGCYLVEKGADTAPEYAMDKGLNEADQMYRIGMYEKYMVLEAGKAYEFIYRNKSNVYSYGASLEYGEELIATDNTEIAGYKGSLTGNTSFKVNQTRLYHIVLDLNEDGLLSDVGGAQCIIVPCLWGIRGNMNDWGYTEGTQTGNKFEWKDVHIDYYGYYCDFKFAYGNAWRINLDIANTVTANTNLGVDGIRGGGNISINETGIYDITLEYTGLAQTVQESFKYTIERTGDLPPVYPETFVYSLIGTINGNWETDNDFRFVNKDNNHYVFEATDLTFDAGEFKIRKDHDWKHSWGINNMSISGVGVSGNDYVTLLSPFNGSVRFEYDWAENGGETNVQLTFIPNKAQTKGSQIYPILLDQEVLTDNQTKVVADFTGDESTKFVYIWDNTYSLANPIGLGFYGSDGYLALTVSDYGWAGLGFCLTTDGTDWQDAEKLRAAIVANPDDYYLHLAIKSTDNYSHCFYIFGTDETRFVLGNKANLYDGGIYSDFTRNGEWQEFDIPMTKFATALAKTTCKADVNIFCALSEGVAGAQLNLDAIYFYKK